MRIIDPTLKERMQLAHMTVANNANPRMEIEAVRPRTPIFHKRFWQEAIVTAGVTATSTSVALQRSSGRWGQRVYVAYVSGGTLTVKAADLLFPVENLAWSTILTIADCTACALEHDGNFEMGDFGRVEYHTTDLWLFYTTAAGGLMGGILGETYESIANSVTSFDAIRGVASIYKDIDQGMLVFYIVAGSVYYQQYLSGAWEGQLAVSIAPADVVSVKASRSFDWRIILHVEDDTGALYEVFSKMSASGWNGTEFIGLSISAIAERIVVDYLEAQSADESIELAISAIADRLYAVPPVMLAAANLDDGNGDFGFMVAVLFDEDIFDVAGNGTSFELIDSELASYAGTAIAQYGMVVVITFDDFNNAVNPISLSYTAGTIRGDVELVETGVIEFNATDLVPTALPPPIAESAENTDSQTIVITFDSVVETLGDHAGFTIGITEPNWVPDGTNAERTPIAASLDWVEPEITNEVVVLGDATFTNTAIDSGSIRLALDV